MSGFSDMGYDGRAPAQTQKSPGQNRGFSLSKTHQQIRQPAGNPQRLPVRCYLSRLNYALTILPFLMQPVQTFIRFETPFASAFTV